MSDERWGAGDPEKWVDSGSVLIGSQRHRLVTGEHPHSRRDGRHYIPDVRDQCGNPLAFSGHRQCIRVEVEEHNYVKTSEISGDEVRRGGSCKIFADGEQVFEFFTREVGSALRRADQVISQLREVPCDWLVAEQREKLEGRRVYWRDEPGVIRMVIASQGCVVIQAETESGRFRTPAWRDDDDPEPTIKVSVTSSEIWWFRD